MPSHYETFIRIVDAIRREAPVEYARFHPEEDNQQALVTARSLALTHLFLKAKFGLTTFSERDRLVTDAPDDGGIDAYYIDSENYKIHLVQTKFRATERNFFEAGIRPDELLAMDIRRITGGETRSEQERLYNGRIQGFIKAIQAIPDIGRYKYEVTIIANTRFTADQLTRLTGGFPVEVFDSERVVNELIFPVVSGNYFSGKELCLRISLDNAQQNAVRINYQVQTKIGPCTITVLFVPVVEIARALGKFKNSILTFNPRSYLELRKNEVNRKIRETIESYETNEFALFNNGITLLASDARFNEHTGRRGEAQLALMDPQIVNGGQTAFTLSRIFDSYQNEEQRQRIFGNKNVLLKVITIDRELKANNQGWHDLVERLSRATNEQSAVTDADRVSNDTVQIELQRRIYRAWGAYYERKRGEYSDGLQNKYIDREQIIDRERFVRVIVACCRDASQARKSSESRLIKSELLAKALSNLDGVDGWYKAYRALGLLREIRAENKTKDDTWCIGKFGSAIRYGSYAVAMVSALADERGKLPHPDAKEFKDYLVQLLAKWPQFESGIRDKPLSVIYFTRVKDAVTGVERIENDWDGYYKGVTINDDLIEYFSQELEK